MIVLLDTPVGSKRPAASPLVGGDAKKSVT